MHSLECLIKAIVRILQKMHAYSFLDNLRRFVSPLSLSLFNEPQAHISVSPGRRRLDALAAGKGSAWGCGGRVMRENLPSSNNSPRKFLGVGRPSHTAPALPAASPSGRRRSRLLRSRKPETPSPGVLAPATASVCFNALRQPPGMESEAGSLE